MTIQSFEASDQAFHQFLEAVRVKIKGRELGKIVQLEAPPEDSSRLASSFTMRVIISKLGTSLLDFKITPAANGSGFSAVLQSEKIALTHRAFRADIESKLARVLSSCGAAVSA